MKYLMRNLYYFKSSMALVFFALMTINTIYPSSNGVGFYCAVFFIATLLIAKVLEAIVPITESRHHIDDNLSVF